MDKAQVLDRLETARADFDRLLVEVGETRMEQPGVEGEASVKTILGHIAAYERWTAAQIAGVVRGTPPTSQEAYGADEPPAGFDSEDMDARNAAMQAHFRDVPLAEVVAAAEQAFSQLVAVVQSLTADQLAATELLGWGDLTTAQAIGIQTWEHYAQHEPSIRAWIMRDEGLGGNNSTPVK